MPNPEGVKKRAVIVGINKYQDGSISELEGAENDAEEIHDLLSDSKRGRFEILDEHYLIGPKATCKNIRKAISDLYWETAPCDLALFYFSGHGFEDCYSKGYIAPYDMIKSKPLVCGIEMSSIKEIIRQSKHKKRILLILDCCHSGIAAKGDGPESRAKDYFDDLKGSGFFTLASSDADENSREHKVPHKQSQGHPPRPTDKTESHSHGKYTFYLIEGLNGAAADDYGIVYLDKLINHVEKQFEVSGKQIPKYSVEYASQMNKIVLAFAPNYYIKIDEMISNIDNLLNKNGAYFLLSAMKETRNVLEISPENENAKKEKKIIDERFKAYKGPVNKWINKHRKRLMELDPNIFTMLTNFFDDLCYDSISKKSAADLNIIEDLCNVSKNDMNEGFFFENCKEYLNPLKQPNSPDMPPIENLERGR